MDQMDINYDNVTDNMNQQIHSNEQIGLLEMPVEILPDILIHLHAKDLLTVSHVCTLLASNAETAFARKYANETYLVDFSIKSERRLLQVILNKYGEKLQKLHINSSFEHDAKDREKLLDLVQQKCCNLKSLKLVGARKMIMLKNLTEFNLFGQLNLNRETFAEFVFNNPQLETLDLCTIDIDWLDLLDGRLNMLKKLVCGGISFVTKLSKIRLNSLETLELKLNSFARLLQTMNCNQIKELILRKFCDPGDVDEDLINEICSFEALASLHLNSVPITENQLVTLAQKLPHLIDLRMKLFEFESIFTVSTHVRSVLSTIQKLKKLTIDLDGNNLLQNIFEKYSSHDLYSNFTNTSTEINIICERVLLSITNDYLFECDLATAELHWMNNLNDKNVQEAMARLRKWSIFLYNLKFINNCAESTLDISSLKSLAMRLDIKSKGPITVNAMTNASHYRDYFPNLKIIKIYLDGHSATGFLQDLDTNFCKQIVQLWIHTENVSEDEELQQGTDMISILGKFEKLICLNLDPSIASIDAKRLFSVCQNLASFHVHAINWLSD